MQRSLLPLILASLGFLLLPSGMAMPLFEWQIREIVTDFPSTYNVDIPPSPWRASIGEALDDGSYILQESRVIGNGGFCRQEGLEFVVRRSQRDEIVERLLNANLKNSSYDSWFFPLGFCELLLCGWYIWWFIIMYKHGSAFQAVIFMGIAGFIYVFLIAIWEVLGPHLGYVGLADCAGTITFNARLSKVHYETLLVFWAGVLLELGALGVMAHQIVKAVIQRKQSSRSAMG